jgi:hypothetical protein
VLLALDSPAIEQSLTKDPLGVSTCARRLFIQETFASGTCKLPYHVGPRLLLNSKRSVKEEMRALVEKFPLGYEGYEGYVQELHEKQEDSAKPLTNETVVLQLHEKQEDGAKPLTDETVVLLQCVNSPGLASSNADIDSV